MTATVHEIIGRYEQRRRYWPTAKALRALGHVVPARIPDDQVVDIHDPEGAQR